MNRWVQLSLWIVCVALALGGPALAGPLVARRWMLWESSAVIFGLAGMLLLLLSTPPDAVRLPRWLGELLVIGGTWIVYEQLGGTRPFYWPLCAGGGCVVVTRLMRRGAISPWWACLAAWHPSMRLGLDQLQFGAPRPEDGVTIVGWLLVILATILFPLACAGRRRRAWLLPAVVWILGTAVTLLMTTELFW